MPAASSTSSGMPTTRAKSLPRPPGMIPSADVRVRELAADLPDQAVAAHHDHGLPVLGCLSAPPRGRARCSGSGRARWSTPPSASAAWAWSRSFRVRPPPAEGLTRRRCVGSWLGHAAVNLFAGCGRPSRCRVPGLAPHVLDDAVLGETALEHRVRRVERGLGAPAAATTTLPPGRSTRAISAKNGGTFTCMTRSKESSGQGIRAASADLERDAPVRDRARPSPSRPRSSPRRRRSRGRSRAGTRARRGAPPRRCPVPRSSTRSGAGVTWRRAAAKRGQVLGASRAAGALVPSRRGRSKNRRIGCLRTGHSHGARATAPLSARPTIRMRS